MCSFLGLAPLNDLKNQKGEMVFHLPFEFVTYMTSGVLKHRMKYFPVYSAACAFGITDT